MSSPAIVVVADATAVAAEAADRVGAALREAVETRGRADWAVTGGSTAVGLYRRLTEAPLLDTVPWADVHVWWGDDRYVPRDHPLSNAKPLDDILLRIADAEEGTAGDRAGVPIPLEQLHPWPTGEAIGASRGAAWCASTLADELRAAGLPTTDGWPAFDLLLLGVGPDGHVLSVFPGSAAIAARDLAMAIPAPTHVEPHVERVTLNPAVIGAARRVLVLATGAAKASVVADVLGEVHDPSRWPAQFALGTNATWVLDEACATLLRR